jgi:glycosyltransferase involved in cell wall biosynthesis
LLTERLDPERWFTKLVTGLEDEDEGNMLQLMGKDTVHPIIMPSLGREISPQRDLKTLWALMRLMRRFRPQIVHTHTAKAGFVGRLAARLTRVPIIVHTFHGNVFQGYFTPSKTQTYIGIERHLAKFTDRIIVLSEQQQQEILSLGIGAAQQYSVIPLGLDLAPFLKSDVLRGQLRAELGIAPSAPVVGIVARLVPIKAVHLLLEAAPIVLAQHPDAIFLIVGDGCSRRDLETQVMQTGIAHAVRFLGFRADLPRIYSDLDCVVLCSLNEGLPVAIIEALASARPVVATAVGSVPNLVESNVSGYLVPPRDAAELAAGINRVLDDPVMAARWGQAGRQRVYPELDIGRLVTDIESLYLDLLQQKGIPVGDAQDPVITKKHVEAMSR